MDSRSRFADPPMARLQQAPPADPAAIRTAALAQVSDALTRIRFGDIRLTVHEGRLVQIDVTERTRFAQG